MRLDNYERNARIDGDPRGQRNHPGGGRIGRAVHLTASGKNSPPAIQRFATMAQSIRKSTVKSIAVYIRVSSRSQDTRSQEPDLKRWVAATSGGGEEECGGEGEIRVEWYRDRASGKSMDRPAWRRLEEDYRGGKVGQIVVWRLDRLGRTARGLTALFEELCQRKVNLVSLKDGLDLSTPAGRLMANVLASVAQYETEVRGERVRAGQDAARAKGVKWGGSKAGRLMANVLASVAQYETEVRGERVRAGQKVARAKGVKWGGSVNGSRTVKTDG